MTQELNDHDSFLLPINLCGLFNAQGIFVEAQQF